MGFFTGGGLIGALLRGMSNQQGNNIRRDAAREWADSFNQPHSYGNSSHGWECQFCGMKMKSYSGNRTSRPSVKLGGGCSHSPYGTHYWVEF